MSAGSIAPLRAEQGSRKHVRRTPFADALRARKQQRMRQTLCRGEEAQAANDLRMSADIRLVLREFLAYASFLSRQR